MLARILPILALVVLSVLGWFLYKQGTIQKIIRPTVVVIQAQRQMIEGQRVRQGFIATRDISIKRVEPGMITFPGGTTPKQVEAAMEGQSVSRNIPKGSILTSAMLGQSAKVVGLRINAPIKAGTPLTTDNVIPAQLDTTPPGGVIVFDSQEEAIVYINQTYDLVANKDLAPGSVLTVKDTSGGADRIFVIVANRDIAQSDRLSINRLKTQEMSSRDLTSGAITFSKLTAANAFITGAGKYQAARAIPSGHVLTADLLSGVSSDEKTTQTDDLPRTLSELTGYMQAYPGRAMLLDESNLVGRSVDPGDRVDMWAEYDRTQGAFGQIKIRRLASNAIVREAADNTAKTSADTPSDGTPAASQDQAASRRFLWVATDPEAARQYTRARAAKGGVSFMIRSDADMVDVLGNGSSCLDDRCSVDREASGDMSDIVARISKPGLLAPEQAAPEETPLTVIDGVSPQLQESLRNNGYKTFQDIADWRNGEMPAITTKLDISNNLAVYIREQARILSNTASKAAKDLGFKDPPKK